MTAARRSGALHVDAVVCELRRVNDLGSAWLRHGTRATPAHLLLDLGLLELCDPPPRISWATFDGGEFCMLSPAGRAFVQLATHDLAASAAALRLLEDAQHGT